MKIITYYLPQFHETLENDKWWGNGFTEWTNVKRAIPLFDGHEQPKIPLNNNFYDLTDIDNIIWQCKLAKEYGIYGFCIYHYWFDGHLLLYKPLELLRDATYIDVHYCICWANEDWTNAWVSANSKTLISQTYGGRDEWKKHYEYLKTFFNDFRYIKKDNKPFIVIYRPEIIPCLNEMLDAWQEWAEADGFNGLCVAYQHPSYALMAGRDESRFDYQIEYEPAYGRSVNNLNRPWIFQVKAKVDYLSKKYFHKTLDLSRFKQQNGPQKYDYDSEWEMILKTNPLSDKTIPGAFVNWDNTPRRGKTGSVDIGVTPQKFQKYLTEEIKRARNIYNKDMLFIFAWNEWSEGGFLEPDEKNSYTFLRAVKQALIDAGEINKN